MRAWNAASTKKVEKEIARLQNLRWYHSVELPDGRVIPGIQTPDQLPCMEFYETTELCGQFDNWVGPNVACLLSYCRAAGFARSSLESVIHHRAHETCSRNWDRPAGLEEPPHVVGVENSASHDRRFAANRDEYVSIWFKSSQRKLGDSDVFPQIGEYGLRPALVLNTGQDGWHAIVKLPPGLSPGWHEVKIRVRDSAYSNIVRVGVGVPTVERHPRGVATTEGSRFEIKSVADGKTWEPDQVRMRPHACISLWVLGLPPVCGAADAIVRLDGNDLPSLFVSEVDSAGLRQINALLPSGLRSGKMSVNIAVGTSVSEPVYVELVPAQ